MSLYTRSLQNIPYVPSLTTKMVELRMQEERLERVLKNIEKPLEALSEERFSMHSVPVPATESG